MRAVIKCQNKMTGTPDARHGRSESAQQRRNAGECGAELQQTGCRGRDHEARLQCLGDRSAHQLERGVVQFG
jgi:hypothetical protein